MRQTAPLLDIAPNTNGCVQYFLWKSRDTETGPDFIAKLIEMRSNVNIEVARLFGLACVIIAHANALGMYRGAETAGFVVDELCRSAVPLFFMISGYFWKPAQIDDPRTSLARLFPKLAMPFVLWVAIYIFLDSAELLYPNLEVRSLRSYITTPWTGGIAFHLWFLPALFVGTGIGMALIKFIGLAKALIVSLGLWILGSFLGTYINLLIDPLPLSVYRNGVFFAPLFLVAGYYTRTLEAIPSFKICTVAALGGAALHLLEGIFIVGGFPHGHDVSIGTIPFSLGVFGMFLHLRPVPAVVSGWGRDVFGAYLVHVLLLKIVIAHLPTPGLALTMVCVFGIFALSLALSRLAKANRWTQSLAP